MSKQSQSSGRFEEILALWIEADRLGVPLDEAAFRERFPDDAAALAEFFKGDAAMKALATPWTPPEAASGLTESSGEEEGCSRLGRYRLIEEIGRGGMGAVFKAWQEGVNRIVAVKVISSGPFASPEELRRFQTEAESAASLSHPGLVPIFEVDVCEGRPFYSMEYVAGTSLAESIRQEPWSHDRAAGLMAEVAEAVDYAHRRGVVHRDLKPANVLIDAAGHPRVTDFGLAKRLVSDGSPMAATVLSKDSLVEGTQTGAVLGTPAYMAPEQAAGKAISPATDIYGLGAILYELLTGKPPFRGSTPIETLSLVVEGRLEGVRTRNPDVPADLAIIVEKCLEREPGDRYRSAGELAEDLHLFLAGEPIRARALSLWGRAARAVGQSRHVSHFRHWGRTIIGFGVTIFVAHLVMQWIAFSGVEFWWGQFLPRAAMFGVLLGMLRASRSGSLMPRDAVERLVWVVWTAYFLAYIAATFVSVASGGGATAIYPFASVLGGMAFFTLGCHVWGACYLVGIAFFLAAPVLAIVPEFAVLGFGTLWGVSLTSLGLRYRWLNRILPEE